MTHIIIFSTERCLLSGKRIFGKRKSSIRGSKISFANKVLEHGRQWLLQGLTHLPWAGPGTVMLNTLSVDRAEGTDFHPKSPHSRGSGEAGRP